MAANSRKHYGCSCCLIVYLNISEYGIRQKEREIIIEEVNARYGSAFAATTVLWKGRLY